MPKKDKIVELTFKPRARLLLQLGDQLIKNEKIALIELVKNSYDADANNVEVIMENVDDALNGLIIIDDNGYGMDLDIVQNVWMEPGSDFKSKLFKKRTVSPKYNRLPIGEKGIGRFGVHKLGNQIEMTTRKLNCKEVYVKINWKAFENYKYLDEVPIVIIERETPRHFLNNRSGTYIVISDLRTEWTRGVAREVKRSITALVSPFETYDSFKADFDIMDKPDWFKGLLQWKDVKEYSLFHFKVVMIEDRIEQFTYEFVPWPSMPKLLRRNVILNNINGIRSISGLKRNEQKLIDVFSHLEDEDGNEINLGNHYIGEIIFEGYIFDRDSFVLKLGVADKTGFKKYLDNNCGIRVFRDGLRVYDYGEPENDWLDLNLRRVNQPTKKLSKNIILGAIYLKRNESDDLIEKTNREGFVENKAYKSFKNSILHAIDLIETLRYSDKLRLRELYGPTTKSEPVLQLLGDLKNYIDKYVKNNETNKEITKYLIKIEEDYKIINENLLMAAGAGLSMSVVIHEIEKIIFEIIKVLESEKSSTRVRKLVNHLSMLIEGYSEIIRKSTQTNENLVDVIEQAVFNTEYRLKVHGISIVKAYRNFKGNYKTKIARNLFISTLMNVLDNSIYWLEKSGNDNKKIFIDISDEEKGYTNIIVADNGTGFVLPTDDIVKPFVSAKKGGMGLGLHIASEIMLAQGGKLLFPEVGDFNLPVEFEKGAILAFSFKNNK